MKRKIPTVTRAMTFGRVRIQWNVSCTTGHGIKGALLNVFRADMLLRGQRFGVYAVKDKPFPNTDAANDWALQHGYLQEYFRREWCVKHRQLHTMYGKSTSICMETLRERKTA